MTPATDVPASDFFPGIHPPRGKAGMAEIAASYAVQRRHTVCGDNRDIIVNDVGEYVGQSGWH